MVDTCPRFSSVSFAFQRIDHGLHGYGRGCIALVPYFVANALNVFRTECSKLKGGPKTQGVPKTPPRVRLSATVRFGVIT